MARVCRAGSEVVWAGRLGRLLAVVREADGERTLHLDDWSTAVDERTGIHHEELGSLRRRLTVRRPDRQPVVFRYRLPWSVLVLRFLDVAHDQWAAEADDPGLLLVELLGGTDDWK
ncbi:hypothetical protein [Streptomyces sp. CBMA156]|uniref:hypothetical protein n=1 Tax=Streptomyces sp. CBMA156 TaxID=1930280 RepID=UPI001661907F|nr:hypothetical protein [Streptomyces sp. CBMA156]